MQAAFHPRLAGGATLPRLSASCQQSRRVTANRWFPVEQSLAHVDAYVLPREERSKQYSCTLRKPPMDKWGHRIRPAASMLNTVSGRGSVAEEFPFSGVK